MFSLVNSLAVVGLVLAPVSVMAQTSDMPVAPSQAQPKEIYIPSGTKIIVSNNSSVTTKSGAIDKGDRFFLTTVYDVLVDGLVAIPAGSAVTAEVTWKTGKGVFGKSGKFDFEMRHVDVGGQLIPLIGKFRQEGDGNTAATAGAVLLTATTAFIGGLFVTGKSADLPAGRQFEITTAVGATVKNLKYVEVQAATPSQNKIGEMRSTCLALGFKEGSEKYQDCILGLIRQ